MAGLRITRRAVVPGLAAAAPAALTGLAAAPAAAATREQTYKQHAGPCGLWRGHTLRFQFFLPSAGRDTRARPFRLVLRTLDGQALVDHQFSLRPGQGREMDLAFAEDGTLTFDGQPVGNRPVALVVIAIIAILIGLLLPAVQKVREAAARSTVTSFLPNAAPGELIVDYLLPFVEQDN